MGFKDRLKEARNLRGLTQQKLGDAIGVAKSTIAGYESGHSEPDVQKIRKIVKALCIDANFLWQDDASSPCPITTAPSLTPSAHRIGRAYEKATPPVQRTVEVALEPYMEEPKIEVADELAPEIEMVGMDVYDEPAAAGLGNYLSDNATYETIPFPADSVPSHADFGVRIAGDSMEPLIADGSIVWVRFTPVVNNGDVGIFVLNGDAFCKQLEYDMAKQRIRLLSVNKRYAPRKVERGDDLRTIGKVLL